MNFEYISAKEAATKLGVTVRWIQQLCKTGKVEGAQQFGAQEIWLVPIKWVQQREEQREDARYEGI
ncbi:MAG: DNA-binding protein [Ruminococcaceae bacterium]|nr:DNA-binding protein [Oscillospiraceae bacterium]